jgi:hypothetical protein
MDDASRRDVLGAVALVGAVALNGLTPGVASADDKTSVTEDEKHDRQRVLACGFTEAEADCWVLLGRTAGKFLELPKLHVMDDHEISHAIHLLQYRLLSRPAYRQYKPPADAAKK